MSDRKELKSFQNLVILQDADKFIQNDVLLEKAVEVLRNDGEVFYYIDGVRHSITAESIKKQWTQPE